MRANGNTYALLRPGEGEVIEIGENRVVVKVANAGQLVCEYTAPARFPGPPLHVHPGFDETFFVLHGQIEIVVAEHTRVLGPGSTAFVKGSVPHTFSNPGDERARFLVVCAPGGFEHYFRALAAGDADMISAISERFGYRPLEHAA